MNIVIVDDDDIDASATRQMLDNFCDSIGRKPTSVVRFTNGDDFLESYSSTTDIVFLDIEMPGTQGVEVARKLRQIGSSVVLIFTTKMAQYAVEGYDVDALGYLVKPFTQQAFDLKMRKASTMIERKESHMITLPIDGGIRVVDANDIVSVEVTRHEVTYHFTQYDLSLWSSLKEVMQTIESVGMEATFSQINRYSIVNLAHVRAVYSDEVHVGENILMLSRSRKKQFMLALSRYHGGMK